FLLCTNRSWECWSLWRRHGRKTEFSASAVDRRFPRSPLATSTQPQTDNGSSSQPIKTQCSDAWLPRWEIPNSQMNLSIPLTRLGASTRLNSTNWLESSLCNTLPMAWSNFSMNIPFQLARSFALRTCSATLNTSPVNRSLKSTAQTMEL